MWPLVQNGALSPMLFGMRAFGAVAQGVGENFVHVVDED